MWDFKITGKEKKPRYQIIADALERDILSGGLKPGERLMTHRTLADRTQVTVSTVTRAYAEAERRGLVKTMIGRGTFVLEHLLATSTGRDGKTGIVELGVAMPLSDEEPSIKPLIQKLMQEQDIDGLVKSFEPFGKPEHREIGASWLRRAGVNAKADSVLIANGHQHCIVTIFTTLFSAGDKIAVDYLTNPGFKMLVQRAGLELEGVMLDEDGMLSEHLDELCKTQKIRGLYLTGNVQNPSAKLLTPERRAALAEVVAKHNVILVEDDSFTVLDTRKDKAMSALVPEQSVYFSSVASSIYVGLRVGFIHAPIRFHNRLAQAIVANVWTVAPLCVALACEAIAGGTLDKTMKRKQAEMSRRITVLRDTLADFNVTSNEHSIYAWLSLPEAWSAREFAHRAEKNGVRVVEAAEFLADGKNEAPNCVRLAITGPQDIATFKRGLDILVSILRQEGGIITPLW